MSISLRRTALQSMPEGVAVPTYDRGDLTAGVLHIGVGNFHRGHMAVYFDRLFSRGEAHEWAIVGAGIRPADVAMRTRLKEQDWLTTVVELDPSGLTARVTGSMIDFVPVDAKAIVTAMSDARIRIVSLTVTEGGYYVDSASDGFDSDHPDMQSDARSPDDPRTIFGMMIVALRRRRELGIPAFTILSCDNLPGNGDVERSTITGLAQLSDPDLARWISENARFPNSMVDGITPATTDRERAIVSETFGIEDAAPVVCESFRQWVIEDSFSAGRPPLEQVGVEFVTDVSRYELMKLRILNAGHAAIAYAAGLLGYHFVHTAMADEDIRDWLRALQLQESIPTLPPLPGVDYARYLETVITRFSNPKIGDAIPRLAAEGSNRQPKFILPTLRDALANGASIDRLALEVALWCVYCRGHTEAGTNIDLQDSLAHELHENALASVKRPAAFLEISSVFGDLADTPRFATAFAQSVSRLQADGVRKTLRNYVSRQ